MERHGVMYQCNSAGCLSSQFLETSENILDLGWRDVLDDGLICDECVDARENYRDERAAQNELAIADIDLPYASAVRANLNGEG